MTQVKMPPLIILIIQVKLTTLVEDNLEIILMDIWQKFILLMVMLMMHHTSDLLNNRLERPKKVTGITYGTNGFHLEFKDNSATRHLGKDTGGNGHNFTTNNFGVGTGINNDSVEDTPTNNWATLNPLHWNVLKGAGTSNLISLVLNLRFVSPSSVTSPYKRSTGSTIEVSSGKWYYEVTVENTDNGVDIGFVEKDSLDTNGNWTGMWSYNYWDQERSVGCTILWSCHYSNADRFLVLLLT